MKTIFCILLLAACAWAQGPGTGFGSYPSQPGFTCATTGGVQTCSPPAGSNLSVGITVSASTIAVSITAPPSMPV